MFDPNYHLAGVKYTQGDVTFSKGTGVVTVNVTADSPDVQLWMENVARPDPLYIKYRNTCTSVLGIHGTVHFGRIKCQSIKGQ